jgi:hypothetical protein
MRNFHPTEPEIPSFHQLMEIYAKTDPECHAVVFTKIRDDLRP